ncbi:hypothetical protein pipiens_013132 [Culex pipiens pipiens]|uniref:Uncharacterized protein n=1 Tax=Culex pipiens pipiens TaxID=38569 RepID=A0ABD1CZL4_CULPP
MLAVPEMFLMQQTYRKLLIRAYQEALENTIKLLQEDASVAVDKSNWNGSIDELFTLRAFLLNEDEKPQIFLLDCPLEGGKAKAKPTWRL